MYVKNLVQCLACREKTQQINKWWWLLWLLLAVTAILGPRSWNMGLLFFLARNSIQEKLVGTIWPFTGHLWSIAKKPFLGLNGRFPVSPVRCTDDDGFADPGAKDQSPPSMLPLYPLPHPHPRPHHSHPHDKGTILYFLHLCKDFLCIMFNHLRKPDLKLDVIPNYSCVKVT